MNDSSVNEVQAPSALDRRNALCLERVKIEAVLLPECQSPSKREQYQARLTEIEQEIAQTYEDQPVSNGPAG